MRLCYKKNNINELVSWMEVFGGLGREEQKNLLRYGLNIMRDVMIKSYTSEASLVRLEDADLKFVEGMAKALQPEQIVSISNFLNSSIANIERNANAKIVFMNTSVSLIKTMRGAA